MNEPENISPGAPHAMPDYEGCEGLRRQNNILFSALIVTSFTLTAYLGVQARRSSVELAAVQPQVEQVTKAVQQDDAYVQEVYGKLAEFGRTHPDFQNRILSKYKINSPATNAPAKK